MTIKDVRSMKERDYAFDLLKGVLIFLVVVGHSLSHFGSLQTGAGKYLYNIIYSFHMPALILISGYFSRPRKRMRDDNSYKLVSSLLIPFVIFHLLIWALQDHTLETIMSPGTMWYLLALFFWRTLAPYFSKIRFILPISIAMSLLIGWTEASELMALSKTVAFFPLFWCGYFMNDNFLKKLRKLPVLISVLMVIVPVAAVVFGTYAGFPLAHVFRMKHSYSVTELSGPEGTVLRLLALAVGVSVSYGLIALCPNKKTFIGSVFGQRSLMIYIGHSFIIALAVRALKLIHLNLRDNDILLTIFCFVLSAILCLFFSSEWITKCYRIVMGKITSFILPKGGQST